MTLLWLAFAILLLPAMWLLVSPLRRAQRVYQAQRDFEANDKSNEQNVAIYKRRLASLEAALERGDIDQARFEEDRLDLDRSLLEDTEDLKRGPLHSPASGRFLVPLVAVVVVIGSVLWYQQHGAEGDLALYAAYQESDSLPTLIERLEGEAASQPDNPKVWAALYPIYRDAGQGEAALNALNNLIDLEGRQPSLLAQKAQVKFFMANRSITDEVQALVDEVMEEDSREPTMLGMLGVQAFEGGDYELAIDRWRRAIAGMGDSGSAGALREGIRVAQQRLGVAPEAQEPLAEGPGIRVRVSLDESLENRLDADTRVFIVARDMEGELPPLAATRVTLGDLPTTLVLDDRHAMSDEASLSQVREARLLVRVSQSGDPAPSSGDMFGDRDGVAVGSVDGDPVELVIDRVLE
ncbi:c-type cytochrome biogenesis protein CcmI [Halomonas campisalis]|uniref:C-type cytochrome biogenesis protein CcmI n=1 Tax=Billgrantia campisalis TaxID=74661 RepID=A0ABS9P9H4_9GAMM|nr:c-type cytochrome biogenesis protein CcmI [Halomonas campisalis]MCG6658418.1 c-type cytochrome biogenesis protein CcmI [Halomonas campisalis]MDR5863089.1 c-type cytochrome biogenesis protein CcmI [Halomonas campisalis]